MSQLPTDTLPPIGQSDSGTGGPFWPRLLKGAALILIGAAAHQWLLPAQSVPTVEPTRAAAHQTDDLVTTVPPPPPSPSLVPRPVAVSADSVPVGTAGLMQAAVALDSVETPSSSPAPPTATEPGAADAESDVQRRDAFDGAAAAPPAADGVGHPAAAERKPDRPAGNGMSSELLPPQLDPPDTPIDALLPARAVLAVAVPASFTSAPAPDPGDDLAGVREALHEYRTAYERLDAAAAKTIWPSVDAAALTQAFRQLASQRLTFQACGISVSGGSALARCRGSAEYVPKVGAHRALQASGEWVFDLAKRDTSWEIVAASVR